AMLQIQGILILEAAELTTFKNADVDAIKSFLSSNTDRFRSPYGRTPQDYPRQTIFGGTTNKEQFLHDPTGARRIWSVKVGSNIDIEALEADRDQLWAEAVARYREGERWWLHEADVVAAAAAEQESRRVQDVWEPVIKQWLSENPNLVTVSSADILGKAI